MNDAKGDWDFNTYQAFLADDDDEYCCMNSA